MPVGQQNHQCQHDEQDTQADLHGGGVFLLDGDEFLAAQSAVGELEDHDERDDEGDDKIGNPVIFSRARPTRRREAGCARLGSPRRSRGRGSVLLCRCNSQPPTSPRGSGRTGKAVDQRAACR